MKTLKRLLYLLSDHIILILIILIIFLSIFLYKLRWVEEPIFAKNPEYHFFIVAQNSVDPFWKEVRMGAMDAAKFYNVAVEFNAPKFNNIQEELKYFDIAILSKVDGIIAYVSNNQEFIKLIDDAYKEGIPVITIENDAKDSKRQAYIGTNSFQLGEEAGKLMIKATKGKANIAIIVSNDYQTDSVNQNLKISGFLDSLKNYKDMKIVKIYTSKLGTLSAEEITQSIINSNQEINAIYTTDSVDTIGTAQVIVDFNKVGEIHIIGYGDTPDILRYIQKGIIYGSVMSDPYKLGYESIRSMIEIKEKNNVSTFVDTGVNIITKDNIQQYIKRIQSIK
ncbi:MAG: sugar-binding protein [Thermoanaerobacteraceae bacterium]